jgi:hypothetical protein
MKPFTFSVMLLLQRVDQALGLERDKAVRDPAILARLSQKKRQLATRLKRLLPASALAGR